MQAGLQLPAGVLGSFFHSIWSKYTYVGLILNKLAHHQLKGKRRAQKSPKEARMFSQLNSEQAR